MSTQIDLDVAPEAFALLGPLLVLIRDHWRDTMDTYNADIYGPGSASARARQRWHRVVEDLAIAHAPSIATAIKPLTILANLTYGWNNELRYPHIADIVAFHVTGKHRQLGYTMPRSYVGD